MVELDIFRLASLLIIKFNDFIFHDSNTFSWNYYKINTVVFFFTFRPLHWLWLISHLFLISYHQCDVWRRVRLRTEALQECGRTSGRGEAAWGPGGCWGTKPRELVLLPVRVGCPAASCPFPAHRRAREKGVSRVVSKIKHAHFLTLFLKIFSK